MLQIRWGKTFGEIFMGMMKKILILLFCLTGLSWAEAIEDPTLRVMCWNIWRAGVKKEESGKPHQVVKLIKQESPDIVAMQETYGSGPWLQEQLGYQLRLRGPHFSIHSKHPILKDLSVGQEWNCIGALIDVPEFGQIAFFSIWLPFKGDIWVPGSRENVTIQQMLDVCEPSRKVLSELLPAIEQKLKQENLESIPVIMAGDFNSMSHFDYVLENADQFDGKIIAWPTSQLMIKAGYTDTYRHVHPNVDRLKDRTWSPEFTNQEEDRIDFIYSRGEVLKPFKSWIIDKHKPFFPSDHAIVMTSFILGEKNE